MGLHQADWVLDGMSLDRPNPARIWDYLLGGNHNFAADRAAAEKMIQLLPRAQEAAVVQRAFLRRAIDLFTAEGIDQFLDVGSGLPTEGNVHDLARATIPDARVVYVDIDPVVIAHSRKMLEDDPLATIIEADLRYPQSILEHEEVAELLNFEEPLGLTMTSILHFILDDDLAYGATRTMVEAVAPGSYVALTHALREEESQDVMDQAVEEYKAAANTKTRWEDEIEAFFDGLEMIEPGVVRAPLWRPEDPEDLLVDDPRSYVGLVGVGRKV